VYVIVAVDPLTHGCSCIVNLHAVTLGVILVISTKLLSGSCLVMYQIALSGLRPVRKTQSGSSIPELLKTTSGFKSSIQSASRTGHSNGNTAAGSVSYEILCITLCNTVRFDNFHWSVFSFHDETYMAWVFYSCIVNNFSHCTIKM